MEDVYLRCKNYAKSMRRKFGLSEAEADDIGSDMFMLWLKRGQKEFTAYTFFFDVFRVRTHYSRVEKKSHDPINQNNYVALETEIQKDKAGPKCSLTMADLTSFKQHTKTLESVPKYELADLLEINFIRDAFVQPQPYAELGGVLGITVNDFCKSLGLKVPRFKIHAFHMAPGRDFMAYIGHPIIKGQKYGTRNRLADYFMTCHAARILALRFGKQLGLAFCMHLLQAEKKLLERQELDRKGFRIDCSPNATLKPRLKPAARTRRKPRL